MAKVYPMVLANETRTMYFHRDRAWQDREQFVVNLGVLLSQTREGIASAYLDEKDQVHLVYVSGYEKIINVSKDSYASIVRDVAKELY